MSRRYSKRSKQQIHWTNVGYNAVQRGLSYQEIRTSDALVNTWITEGMTKARRKAEQAAKVRRKQDQGPMVASIPVSQLDPNNWTAAHNIKALAQVLGAMETRLKEAGNGGWNIRTINAVIERLQSIVKSCPCCGSGSKLRTYDYMTFGIECPHCRLKVECFLANERDPRQCMQNVISAWNQRQAESLEPLTGHVARLVEAAQEANDWLSETAPGTDQHKRSKKLAKALKPFTK